MIFSGKKHRHCISFERYIKNLEAFKESFMKYGEIRIFTMRDLQDFSTASEREKAFLEFCLGKGVICIRIIPMDPPPSFYK